MTPTFPWASWGSSLSNPRPSKIAKSAWHFSLISSVMAMAMAARLLAINQPELAPILPSAPDLRGTQLRAFIGPQSWFLFQLIGIDSDWLKSDPRMWPEDPRFVATDAIVRAMPATNDSSERGCRLATDFKVNLSVIQKKISYPYFWKRIKVAWY